MSSIFTIQNADKIVNNPPSYTQATQSAEYQPKPLPTYQSATNTSIALNLHSTLRTIINPVQQKLAQSLLTLFILLILLADLYVFVVGTTSQHKCPYDPSIPSWLIVISFTMTLTVFQCLIYTWIRCQSVMVSLVFFNMLWLIKGTYTVVRIDGTVDLINVDSKMYCYESVYTTMKLVCFCSWMLIVYFVGYLILQNYSRFRCCRSETVDPANV